MNRLSHVVILFFIIISTISCDSSTVDVKWDDNINLSGNNITISAASKTVLFKTKGTSWWIA